MEQAFWAGVNCRGFLPPVRLLQGFLRGGKKYFLPKQIPAYQPGFDTFPLLMQNPACPESRAKTPGDFRGRGHGGWFRFASGLIPWIAEGKLLPGMRRGALFVGLPAAGSVQRAITHVTHYTTSRTPGSPAFLTLLPP